MQFLNVAYLGCACWAAITTDPLFDQEEIGEVCGFFSEAIEGSITVRDLFRARKIVLDTITAPALDDHLALFASQCIERAPKLGNAYFNFFPEATCYYEVGKVVMARFEGDERFLGYALCDLPDVLDERSARLILNRAVLVVGNANFYGYVGCDKPAILVAKRLSSDRLVVARVSVDPAIYKVRSCRADIFERIGSVYVARSKLRDIELS